MNVTRHPRQQPLQQTPTRGDRPKSSSTEHSEDERSVWGLVLDARCEMAMARVVGPLDVRTAFEHCRRARGWAFRAGAASGHGCDLPRMFDGSPTLIGAWLCGQTARALAPRRLSLVSG